MDRYLAIERPDSPILLVEPKVSLHEILVFVRAAKAAAQPERVVVGPPAISSSVFPVAASITAIPFLFPRIKVNSLSDGFVKL